MFSNPRRWVMPLSLLASALLSLLWIRGTTTRDRIAFPLAVRYVVVETFSNHLCVQLDRGWPGMHGSIEVGLTQYPTLARYWEIRVLPAQHGTTLAIPLWLPMMIALAAPLHAAGRWIAAMHTFPPGHCQGCGYDLRASAGRCPECGRALPLAVTP